MTIKVITKTGQIYLSVDDWKVKNKELVCYYKIGGKTVLQTIPMYRIKNIEETTLYTATEGKLLEKVSSLSEGFSKIRRYQEIDFNKLGYAKKYDILDRNNNIVPNN